jgi:hypothetical protein
VNLNLFGDGSFVPLTVVIGVVALVIIVLRAGSQSAVGRRVAAVEVL